MCDSKCCERWRLWFILLLTMARRFCRTEIKTLTFASRTFLRTWDTVYYAFVVADETLPIVRWNWRLLFNMMRVISDYGQEISTSRNEVGVWSGEIGSWLTRLILLKNWIFLRAVIIYWLQGRISWTNSAKTATVQLSVIWNAGLFQ